MSAELLALAVRAADAYAKVKGPWLHRTGLEAYPDPLAPHELVVRAFGANGRRDSGLVIFDPFPRKEPAMSTPPFPADTDEMNIVAAGAIAGLLLLAMGRSVLAVAPVVINGSPTNALVVNLTGLDLFRVTVERIE